MSPCTVSASLILSLGFDLASTSKGYAYWCMLYMYDTNLRGQYAGRQTTS